MRENSNILNWLEEMCPDRAPIDRLDDFELGRLVGQRELIEKLKIRLKIDEEVVNVK